MVEDKKIITIEDRKTALAILERAMKLEQEGRRFYLNAAKTTQDKEGQETFATLASDEQKHYNLIKSQHTAIIGQGNWVRSSEIKPVDIDLDKPLFPRGREEFEKAVSVKSCERDALLSGLDVEIKSFDLYRKAALEIASPLGKQMFEFLAGQEESHFNMLMMRYDALFGPVSWRY